MKSCAPTARAALLDLGVGGVGSAVRDVVADGAREQERLLGHVAEPAAVRAQVEVGDGDAVDEDLARSRRRRSAPPASPASTCRRRSRRPAPPSRPGRSWRSTPCSVSPAGRRVRRSARRRSGSSPRELRRARRAAPASGVATGVCISSLIFVIDATRLLPLVEHLRELLDRREELVEVQEERDARCRRRWCRRARATLPSPSTIASPHVGEEQDEREVDRLEHLGA